MDTFVKQTSTLLVSPTKRKIEEIPDNFLERMNCMNGWETTKPSKKYDGLMADREVKAQEEIQRKQNQVGQIANKMGYTYMPNPNDWKEAGKKNATGIGER